MESNVNLNDQGKGTEPKIQPTLRFGVITMPERVEWGTYGAVAIYDGKTYLLSTRIFFSLEGLRAALKPCLKLENSELNPDDAMRVENEARAAGFPTPMTRFDRLIANYGEETGGKIIDMMTGVTQPHEGAGPTTFEACTAGRLCRSPNCKRYGKHGSLTLQNFKNAWIQGTFFSVAQGLATLRLGIESGAIDPAEHERIARELGEAGLIAGDMITRKDRIIIADEPWRKVALDVACGITEPKHDAHYHVKGTGDERHVELMAFSGLPVIMVGLCTAHQVRVGLKRGFERGLLDDETVTRLQEEIPNLGLPEGGPDDPRNQSLELMMALTDALNGKSAQPLKQIVESMLKERDIPVSSGGHMRFRIIDSV